MVREMLYFLYLSGIGMFVPFSPCLSQVSPAHRKCTQKEYLGVGGMRGAGRFGVAGVFCSRFPHTGVTGGIDLEKALVFLRRIPFLRYHIIGIVL